MSRTNGFSSLILQNFVGGSFLGQQCYSSRPPRIQEGEIERISLKENGTLVIVFMKGKRFTTTLSDYKITGLIKESVLMEAFHKGKFLTLFFPPQQVTA